MFYKTDVLESGKRFCHKLFWIKFDLRSATLPKQAQVFSCELPVWSHQKKNAIASSVSSLLATRKTQCDLYLFFHKFGHVFPYLYQNLTHTPGYDLNLPKLAMTLEP